MTIFRKLLSLGRRALALAFNHAAERCIAIGLASNVADILGNDEWKPLATYEDTEYLRKEGDKYVRYTQRVNRAQAEQMVKAFNALKAKQGANFRGLPIYCGHPDADPETYKDHRRYGGIMDIEARADGLYVKLAWNDLGESNKAQGYYIYPSPAWWFDEESAKRTGILLPREMASVGLTNSPRIKSSRPWTNSDPAPGTEISPAGESTATNDDPIMKDKLLKLLGLAADATDEQIATACEGKLAINAAPTEIAVGDKKISVLLAGDHLDDLVREIGALATNAARTEAFLNTAKQVASDLTVKVARFRELAMNSALDRALDAGRITAAEREAFVPKFTADFEAASAELSAKKLALNTQPVGELKPTQGPDLSTPAGRNLAFNARISDLQLPVAQGGKGLPSIDACIEAMRANADDAALLKAMGA